MCSLLHVSDMLTSGDLKYCMQRFIFVKVPVLVLNAPELSHCCIIVKFGIYRVYSNRMQAKK